MHGDNERHIPRHLRPDANVIQPVDLESTRAAVRLVLQFHIGATGTGLCLKCGQTSPCPARLAAMRIIEPAERHLSELPANEARSSDVTDEVKLHNGKVYRRVA